MDWNDMDECKEGGDGELLRTHEGGDGDSLDFSLQPHHGQIAYMSACSSVFQHGCSAD